MRAAARSGACLLVVLSCWFPATGVGAERVVGYAYDVSPRRARASVAGVEPGTVSGPLQPLYSLDDVWSTQAEALEELVSHNLDNPGRPQVGVKRSLPTAMFAFDREGPPAAGNGGWELARTASGSIWSTNLFVENAHALRLRIAVRSLPPRSQIWLIDKPGAEETRILGPIAPERADARGEILLPSVPGPEMGLEIHIPRDSSPPVRPESDSADIAPIEIELVDLVEIVELEAAVLWRFSHRTEDRSARGGIPWEYCAIDGTCIDTGQVAAIDNLRQAVAYIEFEEGGTLYACSATLIADRVRSATPYLLTAGHCFSTPEGASTLEATFDYHSDSCDGSTPGLHTLPRVFGATLLATSVASDVTLVRLSGLPTGEVYFMGWTTEEPSPGALVHSLSHPATRPQRYASHISHCDGTPGSCGFGNPTRQHTATLFEGSTTSGSSGSGQILDEDGGLLIGQQRGFTPLVPIEEVDKCDPETFEHIFGAMSYSHPLLEPWLGSFAELFTDGFESGNTSNWSQGVR